jgi:hypothetical protein
MYVCMYEQQLGLRSSTEFRAYEGDKKYFDCKINDKLFNNVNKCNL